MQRKILIVEDNEINREILTDILSDDFVIEEASNGIEALGKLKEQYTYISAVILDLVMPKMDGYKVLQEMRKDVFLSQIPVIVTTGSEGENSEVKALSFGANDYVTKPYQPEILKHRLWNIIHFREQAAIVNATRRDPLTGLLSRSAFLDKAHEMIASQAPGFYCMASFDIEKFKVINDQYGNSKGDEILKYLADIFQDGFGKHGGICCRITADNFAVLYPKNVISNEELKSIHRKAAVLDGSILPLTFSIGRFYVDDLSMEPSAMYDRATLAKMTIKGRYDEHIATYEESMRDKLLQEQKIVSEMRQALYCGQFEVWYQPQFNHNTRALIGAEALVRWRHPAKGLISPADFIPIFETNGFIYELDKFVWKQSCIFLREMMDNEQTCIPISVNISRYDVFRENMVEYVKGLLEQYQIPASLLRLEITESAFAKSGKHIIDVLKELKSYGFTIEIDDFGSGYSSLNTLKDVPADVLKMDMRFLEGEQNSEKGGNILESIVRMARWIDMTVLAEGVETQEQADFLASIGCSYIQGYFYSKPIPKEKYCELMKKSRYEGKVLKIEKVKTYDNVAFWNPSSLDTLIFNSFVGGAGIFEYDKGNIELVRVNDKYAKVLFARENAKEDAISFDWLAHMSAKTKERVKDNIARAIATQEEVGGETILSNVREVGDFIYIKYIVRVIAQVGERYLIYSLIEDITGEQLAIAGQKETAAQLQTILDNVGSGITVTKISDNGMDFLYANQKYYEILGISKETYEKEVTDPFLLIHEEERDMVRSIVLNPAKETQLAEYRIVKSDGTSRWIRLILSTKNEQNNADFSQIQIGIYRDFTEEKVADELFRKSVKQLEVLNKTMNDMVNDTPGGFVRLHVYSDGRKKIEFINKGICDILGYTNEELMDYYKTNPLWGTHPDDVKMLNEMLDDIIKTKETRKIRYRLQNKQGEYIPVFVHGRAVESIDKDIYINAYYTDISKESKEEERRKELMDNLPCGAGIYGFEGGKIRVLYLNKRYLDMVGRQITDYDNSSALDYVKLEDKAYLLSVIQSGIMRNRKMECEIHIKNEDGQYVPFHINGSISSGKRGALNIYVTFMPVREGELSYREILPVILETMLASSSDLSFVKDKSLKYVCASKAFAHMVGVEDEKQVIGQSDYDFFEKGLAEKYRADDKRLINNGEPLIDYIEMLPSVDAGTRYSVTSKYLLKDEYNNVIGIYGVGRDITENKEAFERLKFLTDNIPGGLATFDITTKGVRATYLSDGVYKLTGYAKGEYINTDKDVLQLIPKEERPLMQSQVLRLIDDGTPVDCVFRVYLKDGGFRWINLKGALAERKNQHVFAIAVLFDITEEHNTQKKLDELQKENYRRYEYEMQLRKELIKDSIFYLQINLSSGTIEEIHSKYKDNIEISSGGIMNDVLKEVIMSRIAQEDVVIVQNSFFSKSVFEYYKQGQTELHAVYRRMIPQLGYHWVRTDVSIMEKPGTGEIIAFLHSKDIDSEYKSQLSIESIMCEDIESVVHINVKQKRAYIAHMSDNITDLDIYSSFDFDMVAGKRFLPFVCEEDRQKAFKFYSLDGLIKGLEKEKILTCTYQIKKNNIIHRKSSKAYYLDKMQDEIVMIRRDITNLYEEEQKQKKILQQAMENANKANRAKSEFLSQMSHDIRTPLNAVLAFSNREMIKDANEVKLREYLKKVNISGEYLLGIVNDVLDMSRIEQNKIILNPEPYHIEDFKKTVRNVIGELSLKRKIVFTIEDAHSGSKEIMADHIRFDQIFINLLSNSVKFTKRGGHVELIIEELPKQKNGQIVKRFIVRDNGIGMSKEFIPHAFESFNQEYRKEASERNQGTGLGLSIVNELVKMMDGTIILESELGKGTTFTVDIPVECMKETVNTEKKPEEDYRVLKGVRILLVEDNEINTEIAVGLLEKQGCIIECASNGLEACEKFEKSALGYYQIILMDVRMPVMDGVSASKQIRKMNREDAVMVPIIATTADAFDEDERISIDAGMNAHVAKPINPTALFEVCCKFVKKAKNS